MFFFHVLPGCPQALENRENYSKKIPAGKNQGICCVMSCRITMLQWQQYWCQILLVSNGVVSSGSSAGVKWRRIIREFCWCRMVSYHQGILLMSNGVVSSGSSAGVKWCRIIREFIFVNQGISFWLPCGHAVYAISSIFISRRAVGPGTGDIATPPVRPSVRLSVTFSFRTVTRKRIDAFSRNFAATCTKSWGCAV